MDKQRHLTGLIQLADVQKLRLANEQIQLVKAQGFTDDARGRVSECTEQCESSEASLNALLGAIEFCPDRFRYACQTLLLVEAELEVSKSELCDAETAEDGQRIQWHQNRLQSEWLDAQSKQLGRKLARKKDDKDMAENMSVSENVHKGDRQWM